MGPEIEVVCDECGQRSAFPAAQGGSVQQCRHCGAYVDVGTLGGYREAMRLLAEAAQSPNARRIAPLKLRAGRG